MKKIIVGICCVFPMMAHFNVYSEDWITEEVLKQLTEVRQELKLLKGEVVSLKEEVRNLNVPANGRQEIVTSVELGQLPRLGSSDSAIAIIEFSEYQCPYCSRHYRQTMPLIRSNYLEKNKVQYVKRDFPLSFHKEARGAAIAVRCAASQSDSAYWSMNKDLLEKGSSGLNLDNYKMTAGKLELNMDEYTNCLNDSLIAKKVDEDIAYGQQVGVSGTPAFFIGKIEGNKIVKAQRLVGAQPFSSFSRVVDTFLE